MYAGAVIKGSKPSASTTTTASGVQSRGRSWTSNMSGVTSKKRATFKKKKKEQNESECENKSGMGGEGRENMRTTELRKTAAGRQEKTRQRTTDSKIDKGKGETMGRKLKGTTVMRRRRANPGSGSSPTQNQPRSQGRIRSQSQPKSSRFFSNHYHILSVHCSASELEIQLAAKSMRIACHPDKLKREPGLTQGQINEIDERAKQVGGAADVLLDLGAKARYDAKLGTCC